MVLVFLFFFVFFGSLFFFGLCFFLCFLSCRRFLCVGAMSARGLSSCICQRFAWIDMHFMCILRTLVLPCSEKKTSALLPSREKRQRANKKPETITGARLRRMAIIMRMFTASTGRWQLWTFVSGVVSRV